MIDSISRNITQRLVTKDIIDFDDIDVYIYGFQLLLATIFKGIGLIIIGLTLGYFTEIMMFIAFFSSLRVYAGGYHSKTYLSCFIMTVIFSLLSIFGAKALTLYGDFYLTLGILIITTILVLIYAPVDTKNKPLTKTEYKKYRGISIIIIIMQVLIILGTYFLKNELIVYCNIASIAIFIESLTLINYKGIVN